MLLVLRKPNKTEWPVHPNHAIFVGVSVLLLARSKLLLYCFSFLAGIPYQAAQYLTMFNVLNLTTSL